MWTELKILIDGYNKQDKIAYAVQERIEHHFFVYWRDPVTLRHGKTEYQSELEANKAFSHAMSQQLPLF